MSDVTTNTAPIISYLYRSSAQNDRLWTFPESAHLLSTPTEQIILSTFSVQYECISVIKCIIDGEDIKKIREHFDEYIARQ